MITPPSQPTHVVWDWNGTLLDDLKVVIASVNVGIGQLGAAPLDEVSYRDHFTRPVRSFYVSLLGRAISDMEWAFLDKTFHDEYFRQVDLAPLAPDALEALDRAGERGWGQSILSMTTHDRLIEIIGRRGLGDRFVLVDGLKDVTGGLKAEHLTGHLETLGLDPKQVVLIGDTPDDAAAARHVGARVVLYDGGSHHRHTLEDVDAPVARTLLEALDLVA